MLSERRNTYYPVKIVRPDAAHLSDLGDLLGRTVVAASDSVVDGNKVADLDRHALHVLSVPGFSGGISTDTLMPVNAC